MRPQMRLGKIVNPSIKHVGAAASLGFKRSIVRSMNAPATIVSLLCAPWNKTFRAMTAKANASILV